MTATCDNIDVSDLHLPARAPSPGTDTADLGPTLLTARRNRRRLRAVGASLGLAGLVGLGGLIPPSSVAATTNTTMPKLRGPVPGQRSKPQQSISLDPAPATTGTTAAAGRARQQVVEDDFSDPADWVLFSDPKSVIGISSTEGNPMMVFSLTGSQTLLGFLATPSPADVEVSLTATVVNATESYSVGAFCRGRGRTRYEFAVASNGTYAIFRVDEKGWTNLLPGARWAASDELKANAATLEMGARCVGDQLSLLVGGRPIGTVKDRVLALGGSAGPVVANFAETAELRVYVDDVRISSTK